MVTDLLREHDLGPDFDQQLDICINAMSQDDAVGQTLVFDRDHSSLRMREIEALSLLDADIQTYEMVLFDGGNTHGDRWKHVFFPAQRLHYFIYEDF
ncbi:uridylate kinase [Pseudomonas nabeulensis]|uniref:Uridylate kinase n=2 Tax=Pseudomonas TaxID=286 RepID=A0A4Z0B3W9_9PSED|nr:uridylate kinase [Pseudomonas helleri]MQT88096.1 uridylate kinase [Pseudomonas helleri]TFY92918.1 uridylate kinase [Pseudomonas nabeulensis]